MTDLQQRNYYKIFTGTNQQDGYEKIHLGYESETTEIIFKKDKTTFFHVPFFAETLPLTASTLSFDGAVPGPIPAAADRIFKKLAGDARNNTPWGQSQQRQDGTWLCSWLYAVSSEPPQWYDRYYNPGRLSFEEALTKNANPDTFVKNDPIFYDVPSTLTLESGNWYQFYHQGEQTAQEFVKKFSGPNSERLRLDIEDWTCVCPNKNEPVDRSIYKNQVVVENFKNSWVFPVSEPGYTDRSILSFAHNDFINCKVTYDDSYNNKNEFTLTFWVKSNNWDESPSTQLVGNLNKGGYSIFFDNLKYYPFFVIPENTYGHFFLLNQDVRVFTEKNSQIVIRQPASFIQNCINGESQLISLEKFTRRLYKYNHLGDLLGVCRDSNQNIFTLQGEPRLLAVDKDNNSITVTTSGTYVFDQNLTFVSYNSALPFQTNEKICFNFNGELHRELNCKDIKFDKNNNKWFIDINGTPVYNTVPLNTIPEKCINVHIDPEQNIWFIGESNTVYKINPDTKTVIKSFKVGISTNIFDIKNISFVYSYNRKTNNKIWYALIVSNNEKTLYILTLEGIIVQTIFLPQNLNILDPVTAEQNIDFMTFIGGGDFTGYEWKRVFNNVLYNNKSQIHFKLSGNPKTTNNFNTVYKISVPADKLADKEWHIITATFKNLSFNLFVDNFLRATGKIPNNIDLTYIFKNSLYIGCPGGRSENLNKELDTESLIWDGYIDSIRIYDYEIPASFIQFFIKEKVIGDDIIWNINTSPLQYIETVDRFFKHRIPGAKSNFFNIKISGAKIKDPQTREIVENNIKTAIDRIKPANTELLTIEWLE